MSNTDAPAPEFAPGDRVLVEAKFLAKSDAPIHRVPDATAWVKLDGNEGSTACSLSAVRAFSAAAAEPVSDDDRKRALALAATYEAMAGGLAVKPKDDDDASWDAAQAFEAIYRSDLRFTARALRAYAGGTRDD
jgi:hypothetical protein